MISDGCSYANRKVLIKGVGEHLLPAAQAWRLWQPGPAVALQAPETVISTRSATSFPGQAVVTQLENPLCGGGKRREERRDAW